jgi:hypothetical protein
MLESGTNHMLLANKIKWIATAVTLGGALATTLMLDPMNIWLLNLGALLFFVWGYMIQDKAIMTVNFGLIIIYVFGIFFRM